MERLAAAVLACMLIAACGPTGGTGGDATAGELRSADSAAPANQSAPAFAPEYPGGEIVTTIAAVENGRPGGIFAFRTDEPADRVLAFYRERAVAAGMSTPPVASADEVFMAQGAAGDVTVTTTSIDGRTHAQVTWSARQGGGEASAEAAST